MEEGKRQALLRCVKKDDVKEFGKTISPEDLSVVFGRFPLLSLLYLYDAKRIVKRYLAELVKERPRVKEASVPEAEARFRTVAGKSLRHFAEKEVSPLEMLAVLGRRRELKKMYALYPNASRTVTSIDKVYFTRLGSHVTVVGDKLLLPAEPLSFRARRQGLLLACVSLALALLFTGAVLTVSLWFGTGLGETPYMARSVSTLVNALERGQEVTLKADVTLSVCAQEYAGTLDGDGHVVRLHEPFAEVFSGEISNVTFLLEKDFKGDAVILENRGTIENVRIVAEELALDKGGEYMALLVAINHGRIANSLAEFSLSLAGDASDDCFFAPFAGSNAGKIVSCTAKGSITGKNVDVAGIAGKNEIGGEIASCSVEVELREESDIKKWTPNVAGIADQNAGTIKDCVVNGSVTSVLLAPDPDEEDRAASAYAAGIVCVNVSKIVNCTNHASVRAESTNGAAFAGGIVTLNSYEEDDPETPLIDESSTSEIEHCAGLGEVRAISHSSYNSYAGGIAALNAERCLISSSRQSAFVSADSPSPIIAYAGGIVGNNRGGVQTSFFDGTLAENAEAHWIGSIAGITYLYEAINIFGIRVQYVDMQNNAYVKEEGKYAYGALQFVNREDAPVYSASSIAAGGGVGLLDLETVAAASLDELKETIAYKAWEEYEK